MYYIDFRNDKWQRANYLCSSIAEKQAGGWYWEGGGKFALNLHTTKPNPSIPPQPIIVSRGVHKGKNAFKIQQVVEFKKEAC